MPKFQPFERNFNQNNKHQALPVFKKFDKITDKPKVIIADTIKGKGVSFMEGPAALKDGKGLYQWHSGAPDDDTFEAGYHEVLTGINNRLAALNLDPVGTQLMETREKHRVRLKDTAEKVVNAYGEALVEIGAVRKDLIVLDGGPNGVRLWREKSAGLPLGSSCFGEIHYSPSRDYWSLKEGRFIELRPTEKP